MGAGPARLEKARRAVVAGGASALVVSPGADLRYLTGLPAPAQERLICLVLSADGATLVVPLLERDEAVDAVRGLPVDVAPWQEGDDPAALVASLLPAIGPVVVDDHLWAAHLLALAARLPERELRAAGPLLAAARARKEPDEVAALRAAAAGVVEVLAGMPGRLRPGRSEQDVAAETRAAMLAAGHSAVDYVIVASGPNAASPHHTASSRLLRRGDVVVVDLAGLMPSGYWSDCTRTFVLGEPSPEVAAAYAVLRDAQAAAVAAVRPGVAAGAVDAAARSRIAAAGYGDRFIHRTGHGIGLDVHEQPFIAAGSDHVLAPGEVFSIEPGIYVPGTFGMRLEDIVACTGSGAEVLTRSPRDLVVVEA
jgi:Xaa-Pro aminopeptidase